jgi:hypothetical protein
MSWQDIGLFLAYLYIGDGAPRLVSSLCKSEFVMLWVADTDLPLLNHICPVTNIKLKVPFVFPPPHGYGEYVVDIEYVFVGNYCWKLEYPHGCVS